MSELSHQRLLELLHYDPDTGVFTWRVKRRPRIKAGDIAGSICHQVRHGRSRSMRIIAIDQRKYLDGRLAWLYMTSHWPPHQIDHINCNQLDNRWCNLRPATSGQNMANQGRRKDNKSGFKGVHSYGKRFHVRMRVNGKYRFVGSFKTAEEASAAYQIAARAEHGEFARHE